MRVFKFGGASVKNAEAIRNLEKILSKEGTDDLLIVISAMDKTTNRLEEVVNLFRAGESWRHPLHKVFDFHKNILDELVSSPCEAHESLQKIEQYCQTFFDQDEGSEYDFIYDQIVSVGELLSTKIIASYLQSKGFEADWKDARKLIRTDNNYRNAKVDWKASDTLIKEMWAANTTGKLIVTQGFIGGGDHKRMTTLGREGSDFSAAIFAHCLSANTVTIWKDVAGVLNADPKYFNNTELLPNISYREAVELSYFGASVIHPKTIKPLENKGIPLHVRSFKNPDEAGTIINDNTSEDSLIPSYIFKEKQMLISISSRDFSFVAEDNMRDLFGHFANHRVSIHTMQNSAISFSVSVTNEPEKIGRLIEDLKKDYQVLYNVGLELLTIRHYNEKLVSQLIGGKEILLEQKTRHTMRVLMRGQNG